MTNEEMQKVMQFIVEMNKQSDIKLKRLSRRLGNTRGLSHQSGLTRADARWRETEKGIHALLAKAKLQEKKMAADRATTLKPVSVSPRNAVVDQRLKALADLVERQIRQRRKVKRRKA
jgi:hypothetical protein